MKKVCLGKSGLSVSAIGIGCMRIAQLSKPQVETLVSKALDCEINLFDHADIYGDGESERIFGSVLAKKPSLREQMFLQSKCGIRKGFYDLSKEYILESVDGILNRLGTDRLDLLLLHRPDTLLEPEEIAEAFDQLQKAGKVLNFGVSNMNPVQMELIQSCVTQPLLVNQLQFSAASTGIVDSGIHVNVPSKINSRDMGILEYCRKSCITVQTWSSLLYGWFEGTFLNDKKYPELNCVLEILAERYRVTPAAVAIAFILRHPANMQAIIGSTNPKRVEDIAKAGDIILERSQWYDIYRAAGNELP